jgi:hypothetical protein
MHFGTEQNVGPKPPTVRFEMEALLAGARSTWSFWLQDAGLFGGFCFDWQSAVYYEPTASLDALLRYFRFHLLGTSSYTARI